MEFHIFPQANCIIFYAFFQLSLKISIKNLKLHIPKFLMIPIKYNTNENFTKMLSHFEPDQKKQPIPAYAKNSVPCSKKNNNKKNNNSDNENVYNRSEFEKERKIIILNSWPFKD